jgi:hypothetical protein
MIEAGTHVVELPVEIIEKISVTGAVLATTIVTTRCAARTAAASGDGPGVEEDAVATEVEESPHLAGDVASSWVLAVCWCLRICAVLLNQSVVAQM